jgi:signal transduction histidine kinase
VVAETFSSSPLNPAVASSRIGTDPAVRSDPEAEAGVFNGRVARNDQRSPAAADASAAGPSVARAVAQFVVAGLVAVVVFALAGILVLRALGHREAIRNARQLTVLAGQGIVEPALDQGVLAGDRRSLARIDRIVQERVLDEGVVRVKIWAGDGRIVYSDEPRLIGSRYTLGAGERETLRTGAAKAELSDLSRPENRFERAVGPLYEVYTRIRAPSGRPLLFETYQRSSALVSSGRDIWLPFATALLGGLLLLWLIQVPLAWRLARRLQRSHAERERLLVLAVEASADERRRIAADLHDGVVQDLAGMSYSLSAAAGPDRPAADFRAVLHAAASTTRGAIRQLRSLLVEIHPPNLRSAGLETALRDLLAPLSARGVESEVDLGGIELDPDSELLVFRAAREAIRNVQHHAQAASVAVTLRSVDGSVRLVVADDGVGFTDADRERRRSQGHLGLELLAELAARRGGSLAVRPRPDGGTTFVFEVPDA